GQNHRKVATQSHRSNELRLYDSGTAGIQSETRAASVPLCDAIRSSRGTRLSTSGTIRNVGVRRGWRTLLLLGLALLALGATRPAHAQSANCVGDYGGVVDGNVVPNPPSLLHIDGACTIRNYPASNPYGGSISWLSTQNTLLVFDNVDFTGNMSCDSHQ